MTPVPTEDDVRAALAGDVLAGVAPTEPWSLLLEIGTLRVGLGFGRSADGGATVEVVDDVGINASFDVAFTVGVDEWHRLCADPPPRGATSAQALVATGGAERVRGRRVVWARGAVAVDRVLDAVRDHVRPPPARRADPEPAPGGWSPIESGYLTLDVEGERRRLFVESAGRGVPLLCLHTAGADSRQFHAIAEDPRITDHHRVVAFDMPWHGRSDPPADWQHRRYTLTTATYTATVLAVMDALGLDAPVLLGCSMGGAIALHLAAHHGERFTGVCALEGGLGSPGRFVDWTGRADVDHSAFLTAWVGGLIAPTSPAGPRARTLWGYASTGPGVYQGDTHFYSVDFPAAAPDLPAARCPLYVFSGEYDYSATTEMSREAADRLGGHLVVMPGRGHFPMAEDPDGLAEHLLGVLATLREHRDGA